MKKFLLIFIPVIVTAVILIKIFGFTVIIPDCENAEMVFIYKKTNVHTIISEADTKIIKTALRSKGKLHMGEPFVFPACGFDDNVYFSLGDSVFYPACDRCNLIKYKGKYFEVSENDMEKIRQVLEKYGAYFPCV